MDIQEAIKLESTFEAKAMLSGEAIKMAISALQEQAEREKGCKYCENEKSFEIHSQGEKVGIAYMHKCSDGWALFLEMDNGNTYYTNILNCPMCGKRLK